jgi:hypothetical protein
MPKETILKFDNNNYLFYMVILDSYNNFGKNVYVVKSCNSMGTDRYNQREIPFDLMQKHMDKGFVTIHKTGL